MLRRPEQPRRLKWLKITVLTDTSSCLRTRPRHGSGRSKFASSKHISLAGFRAVCASLPLRRQVEPPPNAAHPPDRAGGDAADQAVRRHVASHDRASRDKRIFADRDSADDGAVGAERRTTLHQRGRKFFLPADEGAWVDDVREDHRWSAEHVLLQRHVVVYRNIVLDPAAVTDRHAIADKHVLAEHDVRADAGPAADVDEGQEAASVAVAGAIVDDGGLVNDWLAHHPPFGPVGAPGPTRTDTPVKELDFESSASTIPPQGPPRLGLASDGPIRLQTVHGASG